MRFLAIGLSLVALAGVTASGAAQEADKQSSRHSLQAVENENTQLRKEIAALREQLRLQKEYSDLRKKVDSNKTPITGANQPRVQAPLRTMSSAVASPDPAANAYAAGLPVKAMGSVEDQAGRIYVWLDGSYQRLNLPNYSLGMRQFPPGVGSGTMVSSFNAHASGGGMAAGVGYLLPYAPSSPWFGSDLRIEVAGSSIQASGTQTGVGPLINQTGGFSAPSLLSGVFGFGNCSVGAICQTTASLRTDYSSRQISGRIATDYRYGLLTLTPSAGLFGGNVRNDQTFAQTVVQSLGTTTTYNAATSLRWTDLGERLGLDSKLAVHPWVTLALGGWVGRADRWTNFAGNDASSNLFLPAITSSVAQSATKIAFLANLEASVNVSPGPAWNARAFVGLNYDDSVPGFSAPIPVAPAGIVYAHETSYYAGGGATYKFH